jgi:hypothetical protein
MAWRDPHWMPVDRTWLAVMSLKHPAQFNRADVRNGVIGLQIEPHTLHMDQRNRSVATNG